MRYYVLVVLFNFSLRESSIFYVQSIYVFFLSFPALLETHIYSLQNTHTKTCPRKRSRRSSSRRRRSTTNDKMSTSMAPVASTSGLSSRWRSEAGPARRKPARQTVLPGPVCGTSTGPLTHSPSSERGLEAVTPCTPPYVLDPWLDRRTDRSVERSVKRSAGRTAAKCELSQKYPDRPHRILRNTNKVAQHFVRTAIPCELCYSFFQ